MTKIFFLFCVTRDEAKRGLNFDIYNSQNVCVDELNDYFTNGNVNDNQY